MRCCCSAKHEIGTLAHGDCEISPLEEIPKKVHSLKKPKKIETGVISAIHHVINTIDMNQNQVGSDPKYCSMKMPHTANEHILRHCCLGLGDTWMVWSDPKWY